MNLEVLKTVKMYVGGQFIRSESERTFSFNPSGIEEYARICQASKKDFRNAVVSAKAGQSEWSKRTAYNRSQILYRVAEMIQGRLLDFTENLVEVNGLPEEVAKTQVGEAIDTFVYYAGFCDKYQQVLGAVNPVNMNYHNFSSPGPMGVVCLIESDKFNFAALCENIASVICSGNSLIVLLSKENPTMCTLMGEIFSTSDLPNGVVNLLTGYVSELAETIGSHMEINAVSFQHEDKDFLIKIKELGTENMKRIIPLKINKNKSLDRILDFVEYKTVWHPIGD